MPVVLIGIGFGVVGALWHTGVQRIREAGLLFIGNPSRQAIESFYELDPAQPRLPQSIDNLLGATAAQNRGTCAVPTAPPDRR